MALIAILLLAFMFLLASYGLYQVSKPYRHLVTKKAREKLLVNLLTQCIMLLWIVLIIVCVLFNW